MNGLHTLKLLHEKYKGKGSEYGDRIFKSKVQEALRCNSDLAQHIGKAQEDLSPMVVLELFKRISDEDAELLWMDPRVGRPERLILSSILVPPVPIRPSVAMDTGAGSNEDDLTVKMQEIVMVNNALGRDLKKGDNVKVVMTDWNYLQVQVAQYLNGEMPGIHRPPGEKPIRGLCQRLKAGARNCTCTCTPESLGLSPCA